MESPAGEAGGAMDQGAEFHAAIFNFINSIVGAGIIGLAFAISEAGLWLGIILLLICGLLTDYSVRLLVETGIRVNKPDFERLCQHFLGRPGFIACSAFMFTFAFGAMLGYTLLIADTVPTVLGAAGLLPEGVDAHDTAPRMLITIICNTVVILPLCLLKDMGSLAKTSLVSISADAIIMLIVLMRAPGTSDSQHISQLVVQAGPQSGDGGMPYAFMHEGCFRAFGAMCFAFVCHHSSFIVRNSMREPERWNAVVHISVGVALFLSVLLSLGGYLNFLACTRSNILNNLFTNDNGANFGRALLALTMFFTFPMENFVARHSLRCLLCAPREEAEGEIDRLSFGDTEGGKDKKGGAQMQMQLMGADGPESNAPSPTGRSAGEPEVSFEAKGAHEPDTRHHYVLTLALWSSATLGGVMLPQEALGIILDFSGGFSATFLGFILPAVCFFRAEQAEGVAITLRTHMAPGILLFVGVVAMITSTFFTVMHAVTCVEAAPRWCPTENTSIIPHICPST